MTSATEYEEAVLSPSPTREELEHLRSQLAMMHVELIEADASRENAVEAANLWKNRLTVAEQEWADREAGYLQIEERWERARAVMYQVSREISVVASSLQSPEVEHDNSLLTSISTDLETEWLRLRYQLENLLQSRQPKEIASAQTSDDSVSKIESLTLQVSRLNDALTATEDRLLAEKTAHELELRSIRDTAAREAVADQNLFIENLKVRFSRNPPLLLPSRHFAFKIVILNLIINTMLFSFDPPFARRRKLFSFFYPVCSVSQKNLILLTHFAAFSFFLDFSPPLFFILKKIDGVA